MEDLVNFLPRTYYDFREVSLIKDLKAGEMSSVIGKILEVKVAEKYIRLKISDYSKSMLYIIFFNQPFLEKVFQEGDTYHFCGKISVNTDYQMVQMINPLYYSKDLAKYRKIVPIYSKIQGMSDDYLLRSINTAIALVDKEDQISTEMRDKYNLITRKDTIEAIHQPKDFYEVELAKERLIFDDLHQFALELREKFKNTETTTDIIMSKANTIAPFIASLPFSLTDDQLSTVRDIFKRLKGGTRVNALVQGDVGSGKTMVAFLLMLIAAENGYQSSLMAPTSVLATQHYEDLYKIGKSLGYTVALLTGSTKVREKKEILKGLVAGSVMMVVGTHALISDEVAYRNLGLSLVDEEHRFGVNQREKLQKKAKSPIHTVTMSATPIPRSLALTTHGENVSVYNIVQMPAGRKPIKTKLHSDARIAYNIMRQEILKGRQCYAVCPLIDESESAVMEGVLSVQKLYEILTDEFFGEGIAIDFIAGSMNRADIDNKIERFTQGKINILISTTIVEVGVNVPNATVMLIQNAERFGLAQLHQLRGRVGRGADQSFCVMVSQDEENEKLKAMVETTNGFKIAEIDLKLRGPGDFVGTKQSGDNKYIMLMLAFPELFQSIKDDLDRKGGETI